MSRRPSSRRSFLVAAGSGAVGVAGGFVVAASSGRADGHDSIPTAADTGFCSDMSTHHLQALAMCQRVLGRDTGDAVQAAAAEVLQTQSIEVGMMRAWLTDWGQSTSPPDTVMAWMDVNEGAGMPRSMMPGVASDDEMQSLSLAEGFAQGKLWIELMRAHHVGGVAMAEAAIDLVSADKVLRLARTQVDVQMFEIAQYDELLSTVYA